MMPPTPLTSSVAPIRSGATSCTLRPKKARFSFLPRAGDAAGATMRFLAAEGIFGSGNQRETGWNAANIRHHLLACNTPGCGVLADGIARGFAEFFDTWS